MKKNSYISSSPSIMRGAPVISGTRVPIERILYMLSEGYTIDEIHNHYPWVSKKTFKGTIIELSTKIKIDTAKDGDEILQTQDSPR